MQPSHIAVVFDAKAKHSVMKCLNNINPIVHRCRRSAQTNSTVTRYYPSPWHSLLVIEGVEADDVIGTLAVAASKRIKKF